MNLILNYRGTLDPIDVIFVALDENVFLAEVDAEFAARQLAHVDISAL